MMIDSASTYSYICYNHLTGLTSFMIVTFDSFLYVQVNFCYSDSLQSVQPHNFFVWINDSLFDIHVMSRQIHGSHIRFMAVTSDP
jgi:hypothetical protein